MGATLTWTALETTPEQMWYALYEDDTNPDDLVGAGIISSTINYPLAGWIITWQEAAARSWTKIDGVATSGYDLATKCGSSGEPGWEWELEIWVYYKTSAWDCIDESGWELDQPFHIP